MDTYSNNPTTIDEAARRNFEAAWQKGQPRPIEEFLPAAGSPNFLATLEELIAIDMEMGWRKAKEGNAASAAPWLENYVARFPLLKQNLPLFVRLVRQEYRVRHRFGDGPDATEYLARFPELDSQKTEILGGLGE